MFSENFNSSFKSLINQLYGPNLYQNHQNRLIILRDLLKNFQLLRRTCKILIDRCAKKSFYGIQFCHTETRIQTMYEREKGTILKNVISGGIRRLLVILK